jgi:carbon-monoxide dehydrogenase medium subunit
VYASAFDYYRAESLSEAHELLSAHPDARLLAGGHSLIPLLKLRLAAPSAVIDIGRVPELTGIVEADGTLRIGALSTHAAVASSAEVQAAAPALAEAASLIGDPAVRNRGTIGGNVAHADPASDLPTVLVALDGRIVAAGPSGERTIPAGEFFLDIMTTALDPDEIVTAVLIPRAAGGSGSAYVKLAHPASRYAVVGCAAFVVHERGTCTDVRVALGGLVPHPRRLPSVEQSLTGSKADRTAVAAAAGNAGSDLGRDVSGDLFASAGYRAAMAPVYVERAIARAVARAGKA